jgi:V-type H+-transporting ATPase subunit E
MAQQIAASNITNKSRLKILNARQQVLDQIFEDARKKLPNIQKDKKKYEGILKNLILEAMYALMEKELFIRARKSDAEIVDRAAKAAAKEFEKASGISVETEVDTDRPLGAERYESLFGDGGLTFSAGGVVVLGHGGKIEYDNTLEERLKLLETAALPKIRASIFGYHPTNLQES